MHRIVFLLVLIFVFCYRTTCYRYDKLRTEVARVLKHDEHDIEIESNLCAHESVKLVATKQLCRTMIQKRLYASSIHYALQSLERVLTYSPSLHCLAEAYYRMDDMLRASFFAEFSAYVDPSLQYMNSDQSFFEYLGQHHSDGVIISRPSRMPTNARLRSIWNSWNISSAMTPYGIYTQYATTTNGFENEVSLGAYHTYSAIFRMHLFLDDLQTLLSPLNKAPQQLCPRVTSLPAMRWPKQRSISIYSSPAMLHIFMETNIGLSDAFSLLGVPHRVSGGDPTDASVVHIMSGAPKQLVPEGVMYLRWGFEKNASVQSPIDSSKVGLVVNDDGLSETHYKYDFIVRGISYWESIPSNMRRWKEQSSNAHLLPSAPYLVPFFPPQVMLQHACIVQQASMRYVATTSDTIFHKHQPIDILFFGNSNPHRDRVKEEFERMAKVMNWNIEFFVGYDLFDSKRDMLVAMSKIVLNLGNHPWPFGDVPRGNALNFHRIRPLLASGKVVLSERCGNDVDEEALKGIVIFANTSQLVMAADALLRDAALRHELENRAVRYIYEDTMTEKVTRGSKVTPSALSHLAEATNQLSDRVNGRFPMDTSLSKFADEALKYIEEFCATIPEAKRIYYDRRFFSYVSVVRSQNASSYCDGVTDMSITIDYLRRRYHEYSSALLVSAHNESLSNLDSFQNHAYIVVGNDVLSQQMFSLREYVASHKYANLIALRGYESGETVLDVLSLLFPILSSDGVILIDNCRPASEHDGDVSSTWRLILHFARIQNIDIALGDFDSGILFIKKRVRNISIPEIDVNTRYPYFAVRADELLPVMTLHELHKWL